MKFNQYQAGNKSEPQIDYYIQRHNTSSTEFKRLNQENAEKA